MIFCDFAKYEQNLINELKHQLLKKTSSKNPTVIYDEKKKQIWLFFFNNGCLKSLWIYDCIKRGYTKPDINIEIVGACLFNGEIFVIDNTNTIYIKKTGSLSFPSC